LTRRGEKVLLAAKVGHETVHGTEQEKIERWQGYQDAINRLHREFPEYSHNKLCDIASAELNTPSSTLRKRTKL
jgi:hypothetical protein